MISDFEIKDGILIECLNKDIIVADIPDEVIEIGAWAFYHCHNLETVNADEVIEIGAWAFRSCNNLKTVNAQKLTRIGEDAFYNCSKLISQPGNYKALCKDLTSKEGNFQYELGVKTPYIKDIKLCNVGYHYVTNIYDIFNYYWGEINEDFVITVTTPEDTSEEKSYDSKKVCHSITDDRILTLKEIRILLNGGEIE